MAAGLASIPQLSGGVPKGYLRVLVFNKDSALVRQRTWQLSQVAAGGFEQLGDTVRVSQDGYVTVYVGNESDVDVLFDDVSVEHRQGLQVQETQYDPAGLELAGLAAPSPGIRGLNNYRFNGKEFQMDLGLNWNHQDWRFLDPTIMRWNGVDPLIERDQESWTPYQFGYDNAVRFNDPNGLEVITPKKDRPAVINYINARAAGTFAFNSKGQLYLKKRHLGEAGSDYYTSRLQAAIKVKEKTNISIAQTYTVNGVTKDVDKDAGGGVTLAKGVLTTHTDPKTGKITTTVEHSSDVIISGNVNNNLKDTKGSVLRDTPSDILAHELVGHAIPNNIGSDTGNAVQNENKVRIQMPSGQNQQRMASPGHVE